MTDLAPAEQDLEIRQGDSWRAIFKLFSDTAQTIPFDATGCEIDMHIREGVVDSLADIKLAASTRATGDGAGKITWLSYASDNTVDEEGTNQADGIFCIDFDPDDTVLLAPTKKPRKGAHETATFIYDVQIVYPSGAQKCIMQGTISVPLEVTRRS